MSSVNMAHNLSFSINLPKTNERSTDIVQSVNETFTTFCSDFKLQSSQNFFHLNKSSGCKHKICPTMQSEKTILCEINAGLWDKALATSISSITTKTYPHFLVVQGIISYLLNSHSSVNIGLIEEFFWKLLLAHGPKPELSDYYKTILFDRFLSIYKRKIEDQNLLICIIEALTACLKNPEFSWQDLDSTDFENGEKQILKGIDLCNGTVLDKFPLTCSNITFFEDLSWTEKMKRCLIALNFIYNMLEIDLVSWCQANESKQFSLKKENRPLICHCLWQEVRDVGLMNKNIYKVLKAFKLFEQLEINFLPHFDVFRKLINLLAEVFRCVDRREKLKYPFTGAKTSNFARELSLKLHEYLFDPSVDNQLMKVDELILNIKPHWFRLILCSYLISNIIGSQCQPDLNGVYDILEHVAHGQFSKNKSPNSKRAKPLKTNLSDYWLSERHKKLKNINARLSSGNTLLQKACEENNIREIRALLKLPDLDVNATNHEGWTALHLAAYKGYKEIVNELLNFRPYPGSLQKSVDARARGPESSTPLMCAASEGHAQVCRLLLEHTGSVLLEDINESNQTPLELAKNKEVTKILKYYVDNNIRTPYSYRNIGIEEKDKEIVIKLCVEMIQSYFCTYRTWDVYKRLKSKEKVHSDDLKIQPELDYERYHRDIKRNIYLLRKLTPKLQDLQEFKSSCEVFTRILSFNKSC